MTIDDLTEAKIAALEAENARLQEALARAKSAPETTGPLVSYSLVKNEETMALLEAKTAHRYPGWRPSRRP